MRAKKKAAAEKPVFDRVRDLVRAIPRGRVATYGQLSRLIDGRLTPVGVGWALSGAGDDLPWHRVVNARGGISTDGHHPGLQRDLLESEGIEFSADGTIDLAAHQWKRGLLARRG